jgi:hypothetical protein
MVIQKIRSGATTLKSEFKKQTATAIMAAFGLVIALAWKDVITDAIGRIEFVKGYGLLISAVILTFVSVLGILFVSRWTKSSTEEKK